MLPSNAVAKGCLRWLRVLRGSSLAQAWLILRTDPRYADLTQSQYGAALELLKSTGLLGGCAPALLRLPERQASQLLFEKIIEHAAPAWLPDFDLLVPDPSELPVDAAKLGSALGLQELQRYAAVRNVHSRADLAARKLVGDAGELALLRFLEEKAPGAAVHVASFGDGYGYDIAFQHNGREWHLEAKSTTRRGRLTVHLSRNEYEVSLTDPDWRLIVVGLDAGLQLKAVATLLPGQLAALAPADTSMRGRWQDAAFEIAGDGLAAGICLDRGASARSLWAAPQCQGPRFEWMPAL